MFSVPYLGIPYTKKFVSTVKVITERNGIFFLSAGWIGSRTVLRSAGTQKCLPGKTAGLLAMKNVITIGTLSLFSVFSNIVTVLFSPLFLTIIQI